MGVCGGGTAPTQFPLYGHRFLWSWGLGTILGAITIKVMAPRPLNL